MPREGDVAENTGPWAWGANVSVVMELPYYIYFSDNFETHEVTTHYA